MRRLAAVAGAIAGAVLIVFVIRFLAGLGGGPERPVAGNVLPNPSFDGPLSEEGDPDGWRSEGSRFTPWSAPKDADRFGGKEKKGLLVVARESEARIDEYTECRTRNPVDVSLRSSYKLGGWIRTRDAQGAYGFRVRWRGRAGEEHRGCEQVYVTGSQTEWREKSRVFTPPAWATRAEVACFAVGNRGKVFFDDVHFAPVEKRPLPPLEQIFGRIRVEFGATGVFDVRSGTGLAARGGELFFVGAQGAETSQNLADAEEPRYESRSSVFTGVVPELASTESVRYRQRGRPGELGVVVEYDLSADRSLSLAGAGVRFTVTGPYGSGSMEVFGEEGPLKAARGVIEEAREVVFTDAEGQKFAVFLRGGGVLRIEPRGDEKLVEVRLPNVTLGKRPTRLEVEFNKDSRIERLVINRLWEAYRQAEKGGDFAAMSTGLERIIGLDRFPKDVEEARSKRDALKARADADLAGAEGLLRRLTESAKSPDVFKTLDRQLAEKIKELRAKYTRGPYAEKVKGLEVGRAQASEGREKIRRGEQAAKLLHQTKDFLNGGNAPLAWEVWQKVVRDYKDTSAHENGVAEGLPVRIKERIARDKAREDAYLRIRERINNFVLNLRYRDALDVMEAMPEFVKHRDWDRIKNLHEDLKAKAREQPED